ncbi:MAG: lipase family protein, partial [Xenococcus sp. (in: cyanobacteria)]
DNDIFIAIRGTQTKPEWINNINFKPDTEDFLNKAKLGKVHKGFDRIYTNDRPIANILPNSLGNSLGAQKIDSIGESIQKTLEKCSKDNPEARVYVVGHSLGAALATLAYAHINDLQYFNNPATLYTFASPRVGTKDFFENLKDLPIYRIFNTEDIITYFPFPSVAPFSNSGSADPILNQSLKGSGIGPLRNFLGKLDFYHVGKPLAFCLHKESILENHIIATYLEGLNKL